MIDLKTPLRPTKVRFVSQQASLFVMGSTNEVVIFPTPPQQKTEGLLCDVPGKGQLLIPWHNILWVEVHNEQEDNDGPAEPEAAQRKPGRPRKPV